MGVLARCLRHPPVSARKFTHRKFSIVQKPSAGPAFCETSFYRPAKTAVLPYIITKIDNKVKIISNEKKLVKQRKKRVAGRETGKARKQRVGAQKCLWHRQQRKDNRLRKKDSRRPIGKARKQRVGVQDVPSGTPQVRPILPQAKSRLVAAAGRYFPKQKAEKMRSTTS